MTNTEDVVTSYLPRLTIDAKDKHVCLTMLQKKNMCNKNKLQSKASSGTKKKTKWAVTVEIVMLYKVTAKYTPNVTTVIK